MAFQRTLRINPFTLAMHYSLWNYIKLAKEQDFFSTKNEFLNYLKVEPGKYFPTPNRRRIV